MITKIGNSHFSRVLETLAAEPNVANHYFMSKLEVETDAGDVMLDLQRGRIDFVALDVRGAEDYDKCRVAGAINLPYRRINAESTVDLPKDKVIFVYC